MPLSTKLTTRDPASGWGHSRELANRTRNDPELSFCGQAPTGHHSNTEAVSDNRPSSAILIQHYCTTVQYSNTVLLSLRTFGTAQHKYSDSTQMYSFGAVLYEHSLGLVPELYSAVTLNYCSHALLALRSTSNCTAQVQCQHRDVQLRRCAVEA